MMKVIAIASRGVCAHGLSLRHLSIQDAMSGTHLEASASQAMRPVSTRRYTPSIRTLSFLEVRDPRLESRLQDTPLSAENAREIFSLRTSNFSTHLHRIEDTSGEGGDGSRHGRAIPSAQFVCKANNSRLKSGNMMTADAKIETSTTTTCHSCCDDNFAFTGLSCAFFVIASMLRQHIRPRGVCESAVVLEYQQVQPQLSHGMHACMMH